MEDVDSVVMAPSSAPPSEATMEAAACDEARTAILDESVSCSRSE